MFELNKRTNLLTNTEKNHQLEDCSKPNMFREFFPYDEIPRVAFNNVHVPMYMQDNIYITDTTFRDGQQSRAPYTVEQIVQIYKYLHRLSGPKGIVRQSEFFLYSAKDREAVYKCRELGYEFPQITSWIRASEKDFELVKQMEIDETGILVSCSDYHIFHKLHMKRSEAIAHYTKIIRQCIDKGIIPRCHFEDITRADIYNFVVPFARELMKISEEVKMPIKIRACDTLGYGVSYPGAMIPRSVPGIMYALHQYAGVPHEWIEWHGHNDFYRAVPNSTAAWLYGCNSVNCSLFGVGERTGNTPLEAMVVEYAQLKGSLDGMDTRVITEIAQYFETELGEHIPPRTPFVGENFNVTRAGIHADGLLKNEEIYNVFDTDKLLNRPVRVAISNTSGLAGIAHWLTTNPHYKQIKNIDKNHPLCLAIKDWVDKQYQDGRTTVLSDGELNSFIDGQITQYNFEDVNK